MPAALSSFILKFLMLPMILGMWLSLVIAILILLRIIPA